MTQFTHLHVHTQFSLLDGLAKIPALVAKAKSSGMNALAITDHGNMFGVKDFYEDCKKAGIKPILGCEAYVARRSCEEKDDASDRSGDHLILLAKNKTGYHNLVRLISYGYTKGFYYKPRIDKNLLRKYHEGVIASSACLGGEIPRAIEAGKFDEAVSVALEFKEIFGDDFYLELMDHGMPEQKRVNQAIIKIAEKTGIKLIATNDSHFINAEDAEAHDILVCLSTSADFDDPKRMRYTGQEYLKTPEEMARIFSNVPEALENTVKISEQVERYELDRNILLPKFPLPEGFENQDDYLAYLTFKGAEKKYKNVTESIKDRLDFELKVIRDMGFAGYFLIVQDFINAAKDDGVAVGPGRGSAAGSAVAYCTGITNVDPIGYKLLFERFLNPERVTMPDIDIDFDDEGREQVLKWVVTKYGHERVGHIITYGSMAAKSSIKDVARVLKLPLSEANRLTKLVGDEPNTTLKKAYEATPELKAERDSANPLISKTLRFAETLEGSIRQTGIHACGIIIGPEDLVEHIPLSTSKDAELNITQYDGHHVENVGMLKMDFLGLKTLSIIKEAIEYIRISQGITIDPDEIPMDDPKTFKLYQDGETVGTFQFESPGMRKYLKELKPTNLEDLFAMNALYRPGPMDFIPLFINRKHGREKTEYPHELLESILKDTYGIMVYQEQIMQAAQIMGGFTLGGADLLRRAMGKKKADIMAQQKSIFVEGAGKKGVSSEKATEVFEVMEKFASYGFNRSHSAAYSIVAFQTAYLKANFPAEYMAAVLSRNLSDIKKITTMMDECKRMGLNVLGPDVNESNFKFTVNKKGAVRFGLAAIKGVGEAPSLEIINERANGPFKDVYDFFERVSMSSVNRKTIEALILAGAFDCFPEVKRHHYFATDAKGGVFLEVLAKYGLNFQLDKNKNTQSLFGGGEATIIPKPEPPQAPEWTTLERLKKEKDLIGIYLSSHPLGDFKFEIDTFCNTTLSQFDNLSELVGKDVKVAGIVSLVENRMTKTGSPFGSMTIEDFTDSYKITFFSKDYAAFRDYMYEGSCLLLTGKVQTRQFNDSNELEFKVNKIEFLTNMTEQIKSLAIKMPIDKLSEKIIVDIQTMVESNKGKTELRFLIYDPVDTKTWINMFSRNSKIQINNEFMDFLEKSADLEFKIFA
jgi:DNA polymerase III subunit alpha